MKTICLLGATLLLSFSAAALSAADPKPQTYTVVGYYEREKPSDALLEKATADVARKVTGMTQTAEFENADHHVEVLFTQDAFEVYVDALPLTTAFRSSWRPSTAMPPYDYAMEKADSARSQPH